MAGSTPPFDCVVGYHLNPLTCGVAKFNAILADKLGIPVLHIFDERLKAFASPLLSIKCSEFSDHDLTRLQHTVRDLPAVCIPWFFLHGFENSLTETEMLRRAAGVFCGNRQIFAEVSPLVERTRLLWSPSTIRGLHDQAPEGDIRIFSFGMAHKLRASHYLRLKALLDASGRIRFPGFLSDDAVLEQLRRATFFVAFFEHGVRDNNSSVIAAMEQGAVVITNLDESSPTFLRHGETVLDINVLSDLPTDPDLLAAISAQARVAVKDRSWDELLAGLGA